MKGPWKHPNGVWYYRGEIPKDLWDARDKLAAMCAALSSGKEVRRSLGTSDRKLALPRYAEIAGEFEERWATLRRALADGPAPLSERNVVALAGERSTRYLEAHQDNPSHGATPPARPEASPSAELLAEVDKLAPDEQERLRLKLADALSEGQKLSPHELVAQLEEWSQDRTLSIMSRAILQPVAETLVREHGDALNELLRERGVVADRSSQGALLVAAAQFQEKARKTLETMALKKDYREPDWVKGVPEFRATPSKHTFGSVIDAEAKRRALGRDAKALPAKTITSFKATCGKFANFRGRAGSDPSTVTADELERWKTDLMTRGAVSNRTVANRVGTIKTVVRWARGLFKGQYARIVAELDEVALPGFTPKPSDLSAIHPDEALIILARARKETDPRLRWLPWLCAYTGLRIAEACQLKTTDFYQSEKYWFFDVATTGKRSLKTINARRTIPLHSALIREGLLAYVQALPEGALFGPGASVAVTRWFHTLEGMHAGVSPNHGWRHLFKDLCRRYELTDDARYYLTGHSTGGADQGYGRTRAMLPGLWRQMERIRPFRL